MKRDMDLVRQIMLKIEDIPPGKSVNFSMEGVDEELVFSHLQIMHEAGLVNGKLHPVFGGSGVAIVSGLTWEGHDWLEAVRSHSVWTRTKKTVLEKGGTLTFELVKAVATKIMMGEILSG